MTGAELLREVLHDLGAFQDEMVFTGGLVLSLYFEIEPNIRLRPTYDADAVVACASNTRWAALQAELMRIGIMPASEPDAPPAECALPGATSWRSCPWTPECSGLVTAGFALALRGPSSSRLAKAWRSGSFQPRTMPLQKRRPIGIAEAGIRG